MADWAEKVQTLTSRPSTTAIKFGGGFVQWSIASSTVIDTCIKNGHSLNYIDSAYCLYDAVNHVLPVALCLLYSPVPAGSVPKTKSVICTHTGIT
jgi:hypothetical protein